MHIGQEHKKRSTSSFAIVRRAFMVVVSLTLLIQLEKIIRDLHSAPLVIVYSDSFLRKVKFVVTVLFLLTIMLLYARRRQSNRRLTGYELVGLVVSGSQTVQELMRTDIVQWLTIGTTIVLEQQQVFLIFDDTSLIQNEYRMILGTEKEFKRRIKTRRGEEFNSFSPIVELYMRSKGIIVVSTTREKGAVASVVRDEHSMGTYLFKVLEDRNIIDRIAEMIEARISVIDASIGRSPINDTIDGIKVGYANRLTANKLVFLSESSLLHHTGVFGATGTGKTTLTIQAIKQLLEREWNIVIFDMKGEYKDHLHGDNVDIVNVEAQTALQFFVSDNRQRIKSLLYGMLAEQESSLTPGMASLLSTILDVAVASRYPLRELSRQLSKYTRGHGQISMSAIGLSARIDSIFPRSLQKKIQFESLKNRNMSVGRCQIVDFTTLPPDAAYSDVLRLLWSLYITSEIEKARAIHRNTLIVMEEATVTLMSSDLASNAFLQLLLMGRSMKLGAWIVGQDASFLPTYLATNINNIILFRSRSYANLKRVGLDIQLQDLMSILPQRKMVLVSKDDPFPRILDMIEYKGQEKRVGKVMEAVPKRSRELGVLEDPFFRTDL